MIKKKSFLLDLQVGLAEKSKDMVSFLEMGNLNYIKEQANYFKDNKELMQ